MKKLPLVDGQQAVIVDIANLPALHSPGQHADQNVTLVPVEGVTFPGTTVQATYTIQEQDVEVSIPGSGISVQLLQNSDFRGSISCCLRRNFSAARSNSPGPAMELTQSRKGKLIAVLDLTNAKPGARSGAAGADRNARQPAAPPIAQRACEHCRYESGA